MIETGRKSEKDMELVPRVSTSVCQMLLMTSLYMLSVVGGTADLLHLRESACVAASYVKDRLFVVHIFHFHCG